MKYNKAAWKRVCRNCKKEFTKECCNRKSRLTSLFPVYPKLYRCIDEILIYKWDPIGVFDEFRARDEYETYVPFVYGLLFKEGAKEQIVSYLREIEEDMTCKTSNETKQNVAKALVKLKKSAIKDASRPV